MLVIITIIVNMHKQNNLTPHKPNPSIQPPRPPLFMVKAPWSHITTWKSYNYLSKENTFVQRWNDKSSVNGKPIISHLTSIPQIFNQLCVPLEKNLGYFLPFNYRNKNLGLFNTLKRKPFVTHVLQVTFKVVGAIYYKYTKSSSSNLQNQA
jgi:hypothetical protein